MPEEIPNLKTLPASFLKMVALNLLLLLIIVFFYPQSFSLALDPLSWLGRLELENGTQNGIAFFLFTATLLFDAFRWQNALSLFKQFAPNQRPWLRILGQSIFLGFLLMAFPCDRFGKLHSIGAGLVVGGFWALTALTLTLARSKLAKGVFLGLHLILHAVAVFCGISFVWDTFLKGFSQRPLLLAIVAELGYALKLVLAQEPRPDLIWRYKHLN